MPPTSYHLHQKLALVTVVRSRCGLVSGPTARHDEKPNKQHGRSLLASLEKSIQSGLHTTAWSVYVKLYSQSTWTIKFSCRLTQSRVSRFKYGSSWFKPEFIPVQNKDNENITGSRTSFLPYPRWAPVLHCVCLLQFICMFVCLFVVVVFLLLFFFFFFFLGGGGGGGGAANKCI